MQTSRNTASNESKNVTEWCDYTFNPWLGCAEVSDGCKNCYAENALTRQFSVVNWGEGKPRHRTSEFHWKQPYQWDKIAKKRNENHYVLCSTMCDVFDSEAPMEWRSQLWDLVEKTENLIWYILTKRPENIGLYVPIRWMAGHWPKNVWLGVTVENQDVVDKRVPLLLQYPAPIRFVSCEPLLGPVDLMPYLKSHCVYGIGGGPCEDCLHSEKTGVFDELQCSAHGHVDWVICGGERGRHARPTHPDWTVDLLTQCHAAEVPFFFKQWGKWHPLVDDSETYYGSEKMVRGDVWFTAENHISQDLYGSTYFQRPRPKLRQQISVNLVDQISELPFFQNNFQPKINKAK